MKPDFLICKRRMGRQHRVIAEPACLQAPFPRIALAWDFPPYQKEEYGEGSKSGGLHTPAVHLHNEDSHHSKKVPGADLSDPNGKESASQMAKTYELPQ